MKDEYYFKKIGTLPTPVIDKIKEKILKKIDKSKNYQWVLFDQLMNEEFLEIFSCNDLKIQFKKTDDGSLIPIQKAFISSPNSGYGIHKDGIHCKSALNIALSSNYNDWIRWYDDAYILNLISNNKAQVNILNTINVKSRDVNIIDYENVPYLKELRVVTGDVYVLTVDKYHSFKCNGPNIRIILQTKFEDYPELETLINKISMSNFRIV